MKSWKNNNDPWKPLSNQVEHSSSSMEDVEPENKSPPPPQILPLPQNPLYNMMDSQQYIQTLEKKLEKLKKKKENPSSKDIISSLAMFQDDQMRNYVNSDSVNYDDDENGTDRNLTTSYMKRKLFPELQAINAVELAELVKDDFVGRAFEESTLTDKSDSSHNGKFQIEHVENAIETVTEVDSEQNVKQSSEIHNESEEVHAVKK